MVSTRLGLRGIVIDAHCMPHGVSMGSVHVEASPAWEGCRREEGE